MLLTNRLKKCLFKKSVVQVFELTYLFSDESDLLTVFYVHEFIQNLVQSLNYALLLLLKKLQSSKIALRSEQNSCEMRKINHFYRKKCAL